jgi:hypothetical protein
VQTEFRKLVDKLKAFLGTLDKLANAREDDERQDISRLNEASGWDARLIAFAATTDELDECSIQGITTMKQPDQRTIAGTIVDAKSQAALPDLSVMVFDRVPTTMQLIGETTTDESGCFEVTYNESNFTKNGQSQLCIEVIDKQGHILYKSSTIPSPK